VKKFPTRLKELKYEVENFMVQLCGLQPFPSKGSKVVFEMVEPSAVNELAAYGGFPTRYNHYSFGADYHKLQTTYKFGLQRIYEMVINNDPVYAYLMSTNTLVDQKLVMAHVYAHADFFVNNVYFSKTNRKAVDMMANHAKRIEELVNKHGERKVEEWIDICLSLDSLIDYQFYFRVKKEFVLSSEGEGKLKVNKKYMEPFINPKEWVDKQKLIRKELKELERDIIERKLVFPPEPDYDVVGFLAYHAPLEEWQREIMLMIREEAYYFLPQRQTKILNEGWATYWHREALTKGLLTDGEIIDFADHMAGLLPNKGLNPYRLGLALLDSIELAYDSHRYGDVYECCPFRSVLENWDVFVAYHNSRQGYGKFTEFLCFWNVLIKPNDFKLPPEFYEKEKLLVLWKLYLEVEEELRKIEDKITLLLKEAIKVDKKLRFAREKGNRLWTQRRFHQLSLIKKNIEHFRRRKQLLLKIQKVKNAFRDGKLEPLEFNLPPEFRKYSDQWRGQVLKIGLGRQKLFEVRRLYNDVTAIDEFFTKELCQKLNLRLERKTPDPGVYRISSFDARKIKNTLLNQLINGNFPVIRVVNANYGNRHELLLEHVYDGRELSKSWFDLGLVLRRIYKVWQRPVHLKTVRNDELIIYTFDGKLKEN